MFGSIENLSILSFLFPILGACVLVPYSLNHYRKGNRMPLKKTLAFVIDLSIIFFVAASIDMFLINHHIHRTGMIPMIQFGTSFLFLGVSTRITKGYTIGKKCMHIKVGSRMRSRIRLRDLSLQFLTLFGPPFLITMGLELIDDFLTNFWNGHLGIFLLFTEIAIWSIHVILMIEHGEFMGLNDVLMMKKKKEKKAELQEKAETSNEEQNFIHSFDRDIISANDEDPPIRAN